MTKEEAKILKEAIKERLRVISLMPEVARIKAMREFNGECISCGVKLENPKDKKLCFGCQLEQYETIGR